MKTILAALSLLTCAGCDASVTIEPTEHGFQTKHIVATRYKNPIFGYNIGFRYLDAGLDAKADRTEVFDFFDKQDCSVAQGGGEPFSEYFVVCKGVTDKYTANEKLKTLLPALDRFITSL